jgi:hypothetical protein
MLLLALVMAMAVLAPAALADDEADEVEGADVEMEEKEFSVAQEFKADWIADYLKVTPAVVTALRTGEFGDESVGHTVGWGVLFRVMQCSEGGLAVFEIASSADGWAVGQLCKDYERNTETPRNFGQLQKENRPEKSQKPTPPGQQKKLAKAGG